MDEASVEEPLLGPRPTVSGSAATEAKRLLRLAGPLIASFILRNAVQMLPLAGVSLAASLANVTGFSFLAGMAGALDTLCGQAFGARQYGLLGVYKQRAMVVLTLACVPIAIAWACAEHILLAIGQDPDIAAEAGAYARWLIPSLAAFVPLTCHTRFLQAQSVVLPVMASSIGDDGLGLWLGIVCGSISKLALLLWITLRTNWEDVQRGGAWRAGRDSWQRQTACDDTQVAVPHELIVIMGPSKPWRDGNGTNQRPTRAR
ncbi:protein DETOXIFICATION 16-like [Panicum miliaceum]|uniref:Protein DETOXIFICATION 16-like n=1 Tax=Panicum miliaceum TaxID=4540 RepID=A0A3L6RC01_PANMI|nr:protein DETOXIFICATION 16-like [Panicum miliaceum]